MTDELHLSRRRVLAGLGTVGLASAGAGLGTSAYFSDGETFEDNTLTAGTLDLKVDWQQTYYGALERPVPVNAYPDHDGDGWQSVERTVDDATTVHEYSPGAPLTLECSELDSGARLPEGVFTAPNRAQADGGPVDEQSSLVALDDVKPGDWGEVTFSLHLCDNPGYLWLTGELVGASENGVNEPEADDADEDQVAGAGSPALKDPQNDPDGETVELLDAVKVEVWYDADCDNVHDAGAEPGAGETLLLGKGVGPYTDHVSLREAFAVMDRLDGKIPLDGDDSTPMAWEDGATASSRDCFAGETQHCVAVRWWLPVDHANEIQSDSVSFDLGFYAEQCRHNDGAGMPPEATTTTTTTTSD